MTIEYIVIAVGIVAFLVIAGLTYWAKRSSTKSEPDAWRLPGTGDSGSGIGPDFNTVLAAAKSQVTEDWWDFSSEEANLQKVTETVTKPVPKKARIAKAKVELKKVTKAALVSKNKKPAEKAKKLPVKKTTSRKTTK